MPNPNLQSETYEQGRFRMTHPDVVAYADAGNLVGASREAWQQNRILAFGQTNRVRSSIALAAEQYPNDPADAWDAVNIPNGKYVATVTADNDLSDSETYDFSVHLVQNGQFEGKRVVRYKFPSTNVYSNIGWLTKAGAFQLWRRFRNDEYEPYVRVADALVAAIRSRSSSHQLTTAFTFYIPNSPSMSVNDGRVASYTVRVVPQLRCFVCAGTLNGSTELANQHCSTHMPVQIAPPPDPDLEAMLREEEEIERRQRPSRTAGRQTVTTTTTGFNIRPEAMPEPVRRERTVSLPMCELGTGQIQ